MRCSRPASFNGRWKTSSAVTRTICLSRVYPSFLDALPSQARAPILDTISALQYRLAEYIAEMMRSEETAAAIERFVDKQIDELLERNFGDLVNNRSVDQLLDFVQQRLQGFISNEAFERRVGEFVSGRLDDLARSDATLAETVTPDTIAFIKVRIDQEVPPIVHHLADIATSQTTRKQIGALIKLEVDQYYEQLSLFKKIFVSRERIHREVDDLVNKTLPKRIEEYLRGEAFEQEAEAFLNSTIDNVMNRPLNQLLGQFDAAKFDELKAQVTARLVDDPAQRDVVGFSFVAFRGGDRSASSANAGFGVATARSAIGGAR